MESCLYEGLVTHRRRAPVEHAFRRRLFMVYLDLEELDEVFRGRLLWSARRAAVARFCREDHLGDPDVPLDEAVRGLVQQRTGARPAGPIRLLTHLRYLGYVFNPVSFYYCFDPAGEHVETVVAEVSNTPHGERHCYVLPPRLDRGDARLHRYRTPKGFYVSPFLGMDLDYDWKLSEPGPRLAVQIRNEGAEGVVFDASLSLVRKEITTASLAGTLLRFPAMTAQVIASIYWQALILRLKRAPYFPHPHGTQRAREASAQ